MSNVLQISSNKMNELVNTSWKEVSELRGGELHSFIVENDKKFNQDVVNTVDFKAFFLDIWDRHLKEKSKTKRQRLRRFMLQVGSGGNIADDYQTKTLAIIETITDDEANVFGVIYREALTYKESKKAVHINVMGKQNLFQGYSEEQVQYVFHSLHSYRLLNVVNAQIGSGLVVNQITPFGEFFYKTIIEESDA